MFRKSHFQANILSIAKGKKEGFIESQLLTLDQMVSCCRSQVDKLEKRSLVVGIG